MKRFLLTLTVVGCLSFQVNASDWASSSQCFAKGNFLLNFGATFWLGLGASAEFAVHDAISVGGGTGYYMIPYSHFMVHSIPIFARGSFHPFNLSILADKIPVRDKMDIYVGPSVGYAPAFETGNLASPNRGDFIIREHIGMRWYFNPDFGLYIEEGSGFGWLNGGIALKF